MDKLRSHNRDRLAPVENALWTTDGVAALRCMPAGMLQSRRHPLADRAPDLAAGRGATHAGGYPALSPAWRRRTGRFPRLRLIVLDRAQPRRAQGG